MKKKIEILKKYYNSHLYDAYEYFGAHPDRVNGIDGVSFTVWAPNAEEVSLVGTFNYWNDRSDIMENISQTGIYYYFFPNIKEGEKYKFKVTSKDGKSVYKSDPFAFFSEKRPETSSVVYDIEGYKWKDDSWIKKRDLSYYDKPMNIYEIHLGSWKLDENDNYMDYEKIAPELVSYVKEMGYTHVEFLPLMEHPLDDSWGYQITGFYSITSRYGNPKQLMNLIDYLHQNDIGVIMDWVPGHFCRDDHGLMMFDGSQLYGGIDHPNWGTKKFDFSKYETINYLISNARFYFEKFHVDGLRVDGVTSIIQLNFGMNDNVYTNKYGGYEDLDGIDFLKKLNIEITKNYPYALMIAEESTDYPGVTKDAHEDGLGFQLKWNMGWMNDTIDYIKKTFDEKKHFHNKLTFSMHYAFLEKFVLPFSHDEVVHGKKTIIDKCNCEYKNKFRMMKVLHLYQMTHPGKKLNFMGNEIGQFMEWRFYEQIEWFLLKYPIHDSHREFVKKINNIYLKNEVLWKYDDGWGGFEWIDANDNQRSIYSYIRRYEKDYLIVVLNFSNTDYQNYRLYVPEKGRYEKVISSNELYYDGTGDALVKAIETSKDEKGFYIEFILSSLTGLIIKKDDKITKDIKGGTNVSK